jgi:excisionase family DNA binding protein
VTSDPRDTQTDSCERMPKRLLTVKDVAVCLQISRDSVFALLRTGELKSVLIRKRGRRITPEQLAEYISNQQDRS